MRSFPSGYKRFLTSHVSLIAIVAAAGSLVAALPAQSSCENVVHVVPGTITGVHDCAVARFVVGDVINDAVIGPPGEYDPGFLVSNGGITGSLLNRGSIFGGGNHVGGTDEDEGEEEEGYGILGALTIATNVSGGVTNTGTISSLYGNGVQLGIGGDGDRDPRRATMTGAIVNSGLISSGSGDGVAALFRSMSGVLLNNPSSTIEGVRGVFVASSFDSWSGGIRNDGIIRGSSSAIQIGDLQGFSAHDVTFANGIVNGATGKLLSGTGPSLRIGGASFLGGISNEGVITQELPDVEAETFVPEGGFDRSGIVVTARTFGGGISNSGRIDGLSGQAIWIKDSVHEFKGGIVNSAPGVIKGSADGVRIEAASFANGFSNAGLIRGGDSGAGVNIDVNSFAGDFLNSGTITGGYTGVSIYAGTFAGDITNSGLIAGGVTTGGAEGADPGFVLNVGTQTGDIINSGTYSASTDAFSLTIGALTGSITNSGLIEATESGATAVYLDIGNGAEFSNVGGGRISGDVLFDGKHAAYSLVAGEGGIEGNLTGVANATTGLRDDSIVVGNGAQYFVSQSGLGVGHATNFANFYVNNLGVAVLGAQAVGSAGGNGYQLSNVDHLHLNSGGLLYVDNQSTLQVGTFNQAAGSTLSFYLSQPPTANGVAGVNFGQISASGPITLSGMLQAVIDPLAFSGSGAMEYHFNNVISTTGSIIGDFLSEEIAGGSAFYRLEHDLHPGSVDLRLVRIPFTAPSCSENGARLGELLEKIFQGGDLTEEERALFNFLGALPEDQVCGAFDQVGGTKIADLGSVVIETAGPWKSLVNDRLNGLGAVGCNLAGGGSCLNRFAANETGATQVMTDATPGTDPFDWLQTGTRRVGDTASWGRMVGVWGGTDDKAGIGGMDFNLTGGIAGIDHVFDADFLAGVAVQYTTDDLDFKHSRDDADIDSLEIGAYGSLGDTRLYLNANFSYIWHDFNVRRIGGAGTSFSNYSGNTVSAYAEGGKIYEAGDARIQPILAMSFAHLETDAYKETGTSVALLSVEQADFTTLKSMIGARFAVPFELESGRKIVPEARAVWSHEYLDNQSSFTARIQGVPDASPFLVEGRRYKRDTAVLGAGLSVPLSDEASVAIDYDVSINPDIVTHTVSGGFRLKW